MPTCTGAKGDKALNLMLAWKESKRMASIGMTQHPNGFIPLCLDMGQQGRQIEASPVKVVHRESAKTGRFRQSDTPIVKRPDLQALPRRIQGKALIEALWYASCPGHDKTAFDLALWLILQDGKAIAISSNQLLVMRVVSGM